MLLSALIWICIYAKCFQEANIYNLDLIFFSEIVPLNWNIFDWFSIKLYFIQKLYIFVIRTLINYLIFLTCSLVYHMNYLRHTGIYKRIFISVSETFLVVLRYFLLFLNIYRRFWIPFTSFLRVAGHNNLYHKSILIIAW